MRTVYATLGLVFVLLMLNFGNGVNSDAWFLLNHGRYVASFGIPHVEPFTLHEGFHFVMQQWLFAWLLWQIYVHAGSWGLVAFSWAAGAAILFAYCRLQILVSAGNRKLACLLTGLFGLPICLLFASQRPQVASALIFLAEIYLFERYRARPTRALPLVFFAFSALLVNLHAAMWPMMLVFLLPYLAETLFGGRFSWCEQTFLWSPRQLLVLLAAVFLGGFCGPYGSEAMVYTLHSYGYAEINQYVQEMYPLALHMSLLGICLLSMFVLTAVYARRKMPLRYLLLAVGTGLMALMAVRSVFLYLLFGTLPLGYVFRDWQEKQGSVRWRQACGQMLLLAVLILFVDGILLYMSPALEEPRRTLLYAALPLLFVAVLLAARDFRRRRCDTLRLEEGRRRLLIALLALFTLPLCICFTRPPDAVPLSLARGADILSTLGPAEDMRLYTEYVYGNYCEFRGYRCYIDARAEVFLPALNHQKNVLKEWEDVCSGRIDYHALQQTYRFTHFVVTEDDILYTYLALDPDYVLIWDSETDDAIPEDMKKAEKKLRIYAYRPAENSSAAPRD